MVLIGLFADAACASAMLPVGSLTLERALNPSSLEYDVRFIVRNLSGTSGYVTDSVVLNNAFFLVDNATRVPYNPGFVQGPDGVVYEGFDYAAVVTYPLGPNDFSTMSLDEDFFNLSDPYWLKLGFKSDESALVFMEMPFAYGDTVLLYASDSTNPSTPKAPHGVNSPKSPKSPKGPLAPDVPKLPVPPAAFLLSAELTGQEISAVTNPEPATMLLFGGGLVGAGLFYRRKKFSL